MIEEILTACNSPQGFVSHFNSLIKAKNVICLKGGSGVGKSTFMKEVGARALQKGYRTIKVPCSSDINSLDILKVLELDLVIVDATAPHIVEPKVYGVNGEIFNLGNYLNKEMLQEKSSEILRANERKSLMYSMMYRHLKSAKNYLDNIDEMYFLNHENKIVKELALKIINEHDLLVGCEQNLIGFASYFMENGYQSQVQKLVDNRKTIKIYAPCASLSRRVIAILFNYLQALNVNMQVFYSAINTNEVEHIGLKNHFITIDDIAADYVYLADESINYTTFNKYIPLIIDERSGYSNAIARAGECFKCARLEHAEIEQHYLRAMDFARVETDRKILLDKIFR